MRMVGGVLRGCGDDVMKSIRTALADDAYMDVDGLHLAVCMNDFMGTAATTAFR